MALCPLFSLCSWVSCCSAKLVHRGGGVWVSYLCSTPGAPHSVRVLHWADGDYTGVCGHKYTVTNITMHFLVPCNVCSFTLHLTRFISLSHRCKLRQGSPFRSVFLGSAAGCKTCSSRWVWSFPTDNRDLLHLHLLKNFVLSSHGQVKVSCTDLQLLW